MEHNSAINRATADWSPSPSFAKRTEGARVVASAELFDLDDTRPKIGQHHRAVGPGQCSGKVQDCNSFKRTFLQLLRLHSHDRNLHKN